jgi:F0F1-type ATP synthase assembly protein I
MLVTGYMAPNNNIKKDIASAISIALEIVFILLVPILFGQFLDQTFNTNFITIVLILFAVAAAFYRILRIASFKK